MEYNFKILTAFKNIPTTTSDRTTITEKHIVKLGSREHVLSYTSFGVRCSNKNCEINK